MLALVKFVPWSGVKGNLRAQLPGNAPRLTVLNVQCIPDPGMPRAEVQVRNTGKKPVLSPRGTMRLGTSLEEGRFVPGVIAPGAQATMTVYSDSTNLGQCELVVVRDGAGRKAILANMPRFRNPRDQTICSDGASALLQEETDHFRRRIRAGGIGVRPWPAPCRRSRRGPAVHRHCSTRVRPLHP